MNTLLNVAPYPVFPAMGGGALSIHQVNLAVSSFWRVELVSQGMRRHDLRRLFSMPRTVEHAPGYCEYRVVPLWGGGLGYCVGQRAGRSLLSTNWTIRLAGASPIRRLLERSDLLQVEHPWQVPTLARWNSRRMPLVMVAHNVESAVAFQIRRPKGEVAAIRERERESIAASDAIIALTDEDKEGLVALGADPLRVWVIPLGMDPDRIHPATPEERKHAKRSLGLDGKRVVLFIGSLYQPNIEAVSALFDLARTMRWDDLVFVVVGRVGERFRSTNSVRIVGSVPDAAPYFAAADLAINPMRSGSGMQVKLLDFLAAGLPTVTTAVGARGLAVCSGRDLMIVPIERFPDAIEVLLSDEMAGARMGANGRRLIEERYDWASIARARVVLYDSLLQRCTGNGR